MRSLRQPGGLSGFPSPFESPHDPFIVGHAGTAISQALGLVAAQALKGDKGHVVAVVGDGSMTSGLSFEALNNAGNMKKKMLIILNDNEMSISKNVGAISKYLNKVITNPIYNRIRAEVEQQLQKFPRLRKMATAGLEGFKHLLVPGIIFEELGFRYFGPVDGHDVVSLVGTLRKILPMEGCCFLHAITHKGKGYEFAERDEERLHGVTPFNVKTGIKIKGREEAANEQAAEITFTEAFALEIEALALKNPQVVVITAAMPTGTGLAEFQKRFPERFFDVGIAEQHAVAFAGGLAKGGVRPVCAIYSTFLQRAYDNLIHDVALQRQSVVLCLDRAGLVGADGATHNGIFDISYLGSIPEAVIAAPVNRAEMGRMLELGIEYPRLFAVRYPRDRISPLLSRLPYRPFSVGEGEVLCEGTDGTFLALGSMVPAALKAAEILREQGVEMRVANMRFAKPLDEKLILDSLEKTKALFTLEEHVFSGGFGARVLEFLEGSGQSNAWVRRLALPDEFIEHGNRNALLDQWGLSPEKIAARVIQELKDRETDLTLRSAEAENR